MYLSAFAGFPIGFDFSITAPQRQETLAQVSVLTAAATEAYARHKEHHLHTAQACEQQGVKFVPLIAESTGTWDPSTLKFRNTWPMQLPPRPVRNRRSATTNCCRNLAPRFGPFGPELRCGAASKLLERGPMDPSRSRLQPSKIEFGLNATHMDPHGGQQ